MKKSEENKIKKGINTKKKKEPRKKEQIRKWKILRNDRCGDIKTEH